MTSYLSPEPLYQTGPKLVSVYLKGSRHRLMEAVEEGTVLVRRYLSLIVPTYSV